ncbi:hypothetical protein BV22DRAFT_1177946, partial [Leucogyrophana mollusca]
CLFVEPHTLSSDNEIATPQREKRVRKNDPPTTQAGSAVARSSCPSSCKQSSKGQGRQKFDNQRMEAVPP